MLADPGRTQFDVNFRLFGFRVRVHPLFWLGAGLLGADILQVSPLLWAIWILVVFISILVHEMGHALAFRRYGSDSEIVLYAFGGLAIPYSSIHRRSRRILVSLAGPVAGFLLAGVAFLAARFAHVGDNLGHYAVSFLQFLFIVNLFWGIFNLLPVYPLDGGQVSRELCEGRFGGGNGFRVALQISIWTAAAIALYSFVCEYEMRSDRQVLLEQLPWWVPRGTMFTGILFVVLALQSYQLLQSISRSGYYDDRWDR